MICIISCFQGAVVQRIGGAELPDTVARANGELKIVEKFRFVYSNLYNSAISEDEMKVLNEEVQKLITT